MKYLEILREKKHRKRHSTPEWYDHDKKRCLFFGFIFIILSAYLTTFRPATLRYLDGRFYDIMLQSLSTDQVHPLPVIVSIDDRSIVSYGQWPWPRFRLANLVQKVFDHGASCVGLDLVLSEPDRCSPAGLLENLELKTGQRFIDDSGNLPNSDRLLAETIERFPVILGYKFLFQEADINPNLKCLHPLSNSVLREVPAHPLHLLQASDVICNLPVFSFPASGSGFINAGPDPDGVLRRVPLFVKYQNELYPDLALACLIQKTRHSKISISSGPDGLLLQWNDRNIPLDESGNLLLMYRGKNKTFHHYSAIDLLEGHIPPKALKDKIVFIGVTASGLDDWHITPLDNAFTGPEVHATVVDNLMRGSSLQRPNWAEGAELFSILVLGIVLALAMAYGSSAVALSVCGLAASVVTIAFNWVFHEHGIYLSPIMPLTTLIIMFSGISILNYGYAEQSAKRRMLYLLKAQENTIIRLAALTETRDPETGRHLHRTQRYVRILAQELSKNPQYSHQLNSTVIDYLYKSAPLHDIGKVGIPDHILLKEEKLTHEEYQAMKEHTLIGAKVLSRTGDGFATEEENFSLEFGREMALSHHEKWDGTGYPYGLKGNKIPLAGRIMALVDVYDALTTKRKYKPAFTHEKAKEIIIREERRHFDPDVVQAFLRVESLFKKIAHELKDG